MKERRMGTTLPQPLAPDETSDSPAAPRSRRDFLVAGALAAAALAPRPAFAQGTSRRIDRTPRRVSRDIASVVSVVPAPPEWQSLGLRLVRRVTNGLAPADVFAVQSLGYQEYLNLQVHHEEIDDSVVESDVAEQWPLLSQTPAQLFSATSSTVQEQLQEATIYRSAYSERQLYQRMVEFWSDHFNIYVGKVDYLKAIDDRDVIRAYAMSTDHVAVVDGLEVVDLADVDVEVVAPELDHALVELPFRIGGPVDGRLLELLLHGR